MENSFDYGIFVLSPRTKAHVLKIKNGVTKVIPALLKELPALQFNSTLAHIDWEDETPPCHTFDHSDR